MLCAVRALNSTERGAPPASLVGSNAAIVVGSQQRATTIQMSALAPHLRAPGSTTSAQVRQRLQTHVAGHQQQFVQLPQQSLPPVHNMLPSQQQTQGQRVLVSSGNLGQALLDQLQLHPGQLVYINDPSTGQLIPVSTYTPVASASSSVNVGAAAPDEFATNSMLASLDEQSQVQYELAGLTSENLLSTGPQQQLQLVAQPGAQYYDSSQLDSSLSLSLSPNSFDASLASFQANNTLDDITDCTSISTLSFIFPAISLVAL